MITQPFLCQLTDPSQKKFSHQKISFFFSSKNQHNQSYSTSSSLRIKKWFLGKTASIAFGNIGRDLERCHNCWSREHYWRFGERNGNPLQYSCLKNPMDRGAWRATVHGVTESHVTWGLHHHHWHFSRRGPRMPMAAVRRTHPIMKSLPISAADIASTKNPRWSTSRQKT